MMRLLLSVMLITLISSTKVHAFENQADIDTTMREVGPGMTHIIIEDHDKPQRNHILKLDISRDENRIEAALANDRLGEGFETTFSKSQRNESDGNVVIGALNADFFGISDPGNPFGFVSSNHIESGNYIVGDQPGRPQFGVVEGEQPFIDYIEFEGAIVNTEKNLQIPIDGVNIRPTETNVVVFTEHISSGDIPSLESAVQIVVQLPDEKLPVNSWAEVTVEQILEEENAAELSQNQALIVTQFEAFKEELTDLEQGDDLDVRTGNKSSITGNLIAANGESTEFSDYNTSRDADELILYDTNFGSSTRTNEFGTEAALVPVNSNGDLFEVNEIQSGAGDMEIPAEGFVVSGHGDANNFLSENLDEGDEITLDLAFEADYDLITALVGGNHVLVENGENQFDDRSAGSQRPRSAVCIDEDETTVYFVAADGDQVFSSLGKDIPEMAAFMTELGCYHALNVDGGGSTTLAIRNEMANHQPRGATRGVANSLLAVAEINYADIADRLEFEDAELEIFKDDTTAVALNVIDEWDFNLPIPPAEISLKVEGFDGHIDNQGNLIPESTGEGWVIAEYLDFSDSLHVTVSEPVSAGEEEEVITEFQLNQNYPNPFNPATNIEFQVPEQTHITITVYDINGREITTLVDELLDPGVHEVRFDASGLASGIYIYELRGDDFRRQKQMMFVK